MADTTGSLIPGIENAAKELAILVWPDGPHNAAFWHNKFVSIIGRHCAGRIEVARAMGMAKDAATQRERELNAKLLASQAVNRSLKREVERLRAGITPAQQPETKLVT